MNKIFRLKFDKGSQQLKVVSELATNAAATTDNQAEINHLSHEVELHALDEHHAVVALPQITSQQPWHSPSALWSLPPVSATALAQHIAQQRELVFASSTAPSLGAVAQSVLAHAQNLTRKIPALALLPKSKALACSFVASLMLATSLMGLGTTSAIAHTNPQVVAGQAIINSLGNTTQIITSTDKTIINWDSFNIKADEIVDFVQRNSASTVLNRVLGGEVSSILGRLQSNGSVFLINPNGIIFGKNAVVDVQNLLASTLNITDADFLTDKLNFVANGKDATITSILNQGMLTVGKDGKLMLLGGNVVNNGVLKAEQGSVYLLAGQSISISDLKNPSISYKLVAGNSAINLSEIFAAQKVQMTGNAVLNQGLIDASLGVAQGNQGVTSAQVDAQGVVELIAVDAPAANVVVNTTSNGLVVDTTATGESVTVYTEGLAIQAGKITAHDIKVQAPNIVVGAESETTALATAAEGGKVVIGGTDYYSRQAQLQAGEQPELARNLYMVRGAQVSAESAVKPVTTDSKLHIQPYQGTVSLYGEQAYFGGTVQAEGGFVETSARQFTLDPEFNVQAQGGEWLLDPLDLRIVNATDGFFFTIDNATAEKVPVLNTNLDAESNKRKSSVSDSNGRDGVTSGNVEKAYNQAIDTYREINSRLADKNADQGLQNLKTAAGLNGVVANNSSDTTSKSLWGQLWDRIFGTGTTTSSTSSNATRLPKALDNFADVYKAIVYNVSVSKEPGNGSTPIGTAAPNYSLADNSKYYFYTIDYVGGYKAHGSNSMDGNRVSTRVYTTSLNSGYKTTSSSNLGTNALGNKNYTSFVSDAFLNKQLTTNNVTLITDQGNITADKVDIQSTSGNSLRLVTQEGKISITDSNIHLGALSHTNPGVADSAFVNSATTTTVNGVTVPITNAVFGTKGHSIFALVAPNGIEMRNTKVAATATSLVSQGNITIDNSTVAGSLITKLGPKANIDDLWAAGLPRDLPAIYQARHAGDEDANVSLTIKDTNFVLANGQHLSITNNYSTTLDNVTVSGSVVSDRATINPTNYYNTVVDTDFSQAVGLGFSYLNTTGLAIKRGVKLNNELLVVTTKANEGSKDKNGTVVRPASAALTFVDNVTLDTSDFGYLAIHAVGKNKLAAVTASRTAVAHELTTVGSVSQGNQTLTIKGANQYLYALQQVEPVTVSTNDFRALSSLQADPVNVIDFSHLDLNLEDRASLRIATGVASNGTNQANASGMSRPASVPTAPNYVQMGTAENSDIPTTAKPDGTASLIRVLERPVVINPSSTNDGTNTAVASHGASAGTTFNSADAAEGGTLSRGSATNGSGTLTSGLPWTPSEHGLSVEHAIDIPDFPELSFEEVDAPVAPVNPPTPSQPETSVVHTTTTAPSTPTVTVPNPPETIYVENRIPAVQAQFGKVTLGAQSKLGVYNHDLEAETANKMVTGVPYSVGSSVDFYFGDDVTVGNHAQLRLLSAGAINLGNRKEATPVDIGVFGTITVPPALTKFTTATGSAVEMMASNIEINNVSVTLGSDLHLHGYLKTLANDSTKITKQVFKTLDQRASDFKVNVTNSNFNRNSDFTFVLPPVEGATVSLPSSATPSVVINNHATKGQVTVQNGSFTDVNLDTQVANEMNMHLAGAQFTNADLSVHGYEANHASYYDGLGHLYTDLNGYVDPTYRQVIAPNTRGYGAIATVTDSKLNLSGQDVQLKDATLRISNLDSAYLGQSTTDKYNSIGGLNVELDKRSHAEINLRASAPNAENPNRAGNLELHNTNFSGEAYNLSLEADNLTFGDSVNIDAQTMTFAAEHKLLQSSGDLVLNVVTEKVTGVELPPLPTYVTLHAGDNMLLNGEVNTNGDSLVLDASNIELTDASSIATNQGDVFLGKQDVAGSIVAQGKLNARNVILRHDTQFGDGKAHTADVNTTSATQWHVANVSATGNLHLNGGHLVANQVHVAGDLHTNTGNRFVAQGVSVNGTATFADNTRAFLPKLHANTVVVDNAQVRANNVTAETAVSAVNDALLATKQLVAPELVVNASAVTAVDVVTNATQVSNTGTLVADKSISAQNLEVIGKDTLVRANNITAESVVVSSGSLGVFESLTTDNLHAQNAHVAATNGKVTVANQATFNKTLFEAKEFATKDVIGFNRSDLRIIDLNAANLLDMRASKLVAGNVTVGTAEQHATLVNIETSNVSVAHDADIHVVDYQSSGNGLFTAGKTFRADIDDTLDIADNSDRVAIGANDIVIKVKAYQAPKENLVVGTHSTNITCEVSNVMNCMNPADIMIDPATQSLLDNAFKIDLGAIFSAAGSSNSSDNTGSSEKSSDDDGSDEEENTNSTTPNQGTVGVGTPNDSTSTSQPNNSGNQGSNSDKNSDKNTNDSVSSTPLPQPSKPTATPPKVTVPSGSRNQSVRDQLGFQKVTTTPKPSVGSSNTGSTSTGGSSLPTPSVPSVNGVVGKTTIKVPQPSAATLNKVVREGVNNVALPYGSSDAQFDKLNQVNIQSVFSRLGQDPVSNFKATQSTLDSAKEAVKPTVPQSAKGTSVTMPAPKALRPEDLPTIKLQTPEETPNFYTSTTPDTSSMLGTQKVQVLVERSTARDLSILNKAMPRLLEGQGFTECKFINKGGVMSVCAAPENYPKVPVPAPSSSKKVTPQVAPNPPVGNNSTAPVVPRGTISVPNNVPAGSGLTLPTNKK